MEKGVASVSGKETSRRLKISKWPMPWEAWGMMLREFGRHFGAIKGTIEGGPFLGA